MGFSKSYKQILSWHPEKWMESVFGVGLIVGIKTIDKGLSYGDQI